MELDRYDALNRRVYTCPLCKRKKNRDFKGLDSFLNHCQDVHECSKIKREKMRTSKQKEYDNELAKKLNWKTNGFGLKDVTNNGASSTQPSEENVHLTKDVPQQYSTSKMVDRADGNQSTTEFTCSKCPEIVVGDGALFKHYQKVHNIKYPALARKLVQSQIQKIVLRRLQNSATVASPSSSNNNKPAVANRKRRYKLGVKKISPSTGIPSIAMKESAKKHKFPKPVRIRRANKVKEKKEFQCRECDSSFSRNSNLKTHVRKVHRQEKNHFCQVCGAGFFGKSDLTRHSGKHGQVSFTCEECVPPKTFTQEDNLRSHQDRFHSPKIYTCDCGKSFGSTGLLKQHRMSHFEKNFACPICHEECKTHMGVYRHIRVQHSEGVSLYECHLCPETGHSYVTQNNGNLQQHFMTVHTAETRCCCPECGRGFKTKNHLPRHMNDVHLNPLSHHCHLCPRSLSAASSLKLHLRRHEDGNNFSCFVCQIDFDSKDDLIRHTLSPVHKENWGDERKARPIEKEEDFCQNLKIILSPDRETRIKKTCPHKNCIICEKALAADSVYYQDSYIPITDIFDCQSTNVIYLIVCTNPLCCPVQDDSPSSLLAFYRYCGQTKNFCQRMDQHFALNSTHNPVFAAHFKTCGSQWLRCIPLSKTLNLQSSLNFEEIDIIAALKCTDGFTGGLNFLAGGQYSNLD